MGLKQATDKLHGVLLKQVIVDENLKIHINILGKRIDTNKYDIESCVSSIKMLQNILFRIDSINICQGCIIPEELKYMQCRVIDTDCMNTLRHKNCSLLSEDLQCTKCSTIKKHYYKNSLEKRKIL